MRWCSWLRHCATSRNFAGSIPDGVIGNFQWHNPSDHTRTLVLTQPVTEMSTRNISWISRRPVRKADNIATFMCRFSWNLGASTSWNPQGLSSLVMGFLYRYIYLLINYFQSFTQISASRQRLEKFIVTNFQAFSLKVITAELSLRDLEFRRCAKSDDVKIWQSITA